MESKKKVKAGRVLWMRHIRPENVPIAYEALDDTQPIPINLDIGSKIEKINTVQIEELPLDTLSHQLEDQLLSIEEAIDSVEYEMINHVVNKGDTYYNIANRYGVRVLDLVKWNKLTLSDKLSVDQQLIIFVEMSDELEKLEKEPIVTQDKSSNYHLVEKGETMYSISRKYGLTLEALKNLNNKTENEVAIGERLMVFDKD